MEKSKRVGLGVILISILVCLSGVMLKNRWSEDWSLMKEISVSNFFYMEYNCQDVTKAKYEYGRYVESKGQECDRFTIGLDAFVVFNLFAMFYGIAIYLGILNYPLNKK